MERFWKVDFDFVIQLKRLTSTLNFTSSHILETEARERERETERRGGIQGKEEKERETAIGVVWEKLVQDDMHELETCLCFVHTSKIFT